MLGIKKSVRIFKIRVAKTESACAVVHLLRKALHASRAGERKSGRRVVRGCEQERQKKLPDGEYLTLAKIYRRAFYSDSTRRYLYPFVKRHSFGGDKRCHYFRRACLAHAVARVAVNLQNIVTVVALVGAQRGGGALLRRRDDNGYFARETVSPARFDVPFAGSTDNITAMIDALPINYKTSGYLHAGYQVIAVRTPGQDHSSGIGSLKKNNAGSPLGGGSGGLRLCEFVAYMRPLTDDEMCDASAFLMQKWLGKTAPGYRTVNAVNKVVAAGDVKINVENAVARIGELSKESGSLRKTGDGILEYQKTDFEEFSVAGGGVRKCKIQDVASVCELADGPALHLDVSDVKSMHGKTVDGERRVYEWYSKNDRSVMATLPFYFDGNRSAYGSDKYAPYLSSEVKLNGFDTLDFGPYSAAEGGRALSLSRSFDSVRSAYIVWTPRDDSRGNYFGCSKSNADGTTNGEYYDFLRSETATNSAQLVMENGTSQHVREGAIYTNGVKVSSSTVPKAGVFTLTEFHPAAAAHISGIGTDRDVVRLCGGIRVAEVVLYERKLSAREKVATRNYLMKKWFNSEPEALPEEDSEDDGFVKFAVMGDVSVDAADTIAIDRLIGEGQVEKSGEDELSIKELNGFTGTVAVTEGELKLVGRNLPDDGAIVAQDALIYHADATSGITAITNDNGKVEVVEWKSKLNDGWSAVPFYEDRKPTLVKADDLNGGYVVDMGMKGDKQAMLFVKNGETNLLDNIVTVFWMVGSHNGGGYLLGGGRHYSDPVGGRFNFMRGSSGGIGDKSEYPILNSNGSSWPVPYNLQNADWRKDGLEVDPKTEPLSGGWDLLSMRITYNQQPKTNADGFAFDGRTMVDGSLTTYMGSQRLAEVLIYNRKLTDEETRSVETYLARKWRFKGTSPEATNSVEVVLGDGTSLDLGGNRQYLASLSGSGSVKNGLLAAGRLTVDAAGNEHPVFAADARFSVERGMRVFVVNAQNVKAGDSVTIVECADMAGTENLSGCVIEDDGSVPHYLKVRLSYADGKLKVVFRAKPTFIIIR